MESSQEVQVVVFHSSDPVEGPCPKIPQRTVVVRVEHSTRGGVALPNTLESCCFVCVSGCDIVRDADASVRGST